MFFLVLLFGCGPSFKNKKLAVKYEKDGLSLMRVNYGGKQEYLYLTDNIDSVASMEPVAIIDWSFDDFLYFNLVFEEKEIYICSDGGGSLKSLIDNPILKEHTDVNNIGFMEYKNEKLKERKLWCILALLTNFKEELEFNKNTDVKVTCLIGCIEDAVPFSPFNL